MGKGRAEKWSPKWLDNKMKAKGLQKLKWYCQMCQKQCRDENGFKCHRTSEQHLRQMQLFIQKPGKYMSDFSREFESTFMRILSTRYRSTRVLANQVYQDLISDKQHVHMNSTAWCTLTGFVLYLGRTGKANIEKTERGWYIEYIDKERMEREAKYKEDKKYEAAEEKQEERLIAKQIEMAKAEADKSGIKEGERKPTTLERKDDNDIIELGVTNIINAKRNIKGVTVNKNINVLEEAAIKAAENNAKQEAELWMKMEQEDDNIIDIPTDDDDHHHPGEEVEEKAEHDDDDVKQENKRQRIDNREDKKRGDVNDDAWLVKGIIVKVLSKLSNGKYLKCKGEIKKIISPYVCHVKMLKSGDILELDQNDLETVTPANGRPVRIVLGKYRDKYGILKQVNINNGDCIVILNNNKQVILRPDDICKINDSNI